MLNQPNFVTSNNVNLRYSVFEHCDNQSSPNLFQYWLALFTTQAQSTIPCIGIVNNVGIVVDM